MSVGKNIKQHRMAAGLSQNELAARAGVNQSNLSRIERLDDDSCTVNTLRAIAAVLGCSVAELIGEEEPVTPASQRKKRFPSPSTQELNERIKALEKRLERMEAA
jgi:transcriptional regulator with XRE-family HTH domain